MLEVEAGVPEDSLLKVEAGDSKGLLAGGGGWVFQRNLLMVGGCWRVKKKEEQ